MSKVTEMVYNLAKPFADEFGLELVEVNYEKKHDGMNLTLIIDKDGGVDINDCEKLHRAIDEPLDQLNPTDDHPYILNVSSPGLDRPLTKTRDFEKNINKTIIVKLYAPVNGKKTYTGTLVSFDESVFTIDISGEKVTFDRAKTASVVPFIKF